MIIDLEKCKNKNKKWIKKQKNETKIFLTHYQYIMTTLFYLFI